MGHHRNRQQHSIPRPGHAGFGIRVGWSELKTKTPRHSSVLYVTVVSLKINLVKGEEPRMTVVVTVSAGNSCHATTSAPSCQRHVSEIFSLSSTSISDMECSGFVQINTSTNLFHVLYLHAFLFPHHEPTASITSTVYESCVWFIFTSCALISKNISCNPGVQSE